MDPVVLKYDAGHDRPWWLKRGRETFFPDLQARNWQHLRWATAAEAVEWCQRNLGVTPVDDTGAQRTDHEPPPGQIEMGL